MGLRVVPVTLWNGERAHRVLGWQDDFEDDLPPPLQEYADAITPEPLTDGELEAILHAARDKGEP